MADMRINIKDEQSAKAWLAMVQDINTDYSRHMGEAAKVLQEMNTFAEGTVVDELVDFATDLLKAAQETYDAIEKISNTVTTVLEKVGGFIGEAVDGLSKLGGLIFGR